MTCSRVNSTLLYFYLNQVTEVTVNLQVNWNWKCPAGTEWHSYPALTNGSTDSADSVQVLKCTVQLHVRH